MKQVPEVIVSNQPCYLFLFPSITTSLRFTHKNNLKRVILFRSIKRTIYEIIFVKSIKKICVMARILRENFRFLF